VPSLAETASAIVAEAREIADRVDHANRKYRHTRDKAALIVSEAIGVPYSEEVLRKRRWPCIIVQGRALYADEDLIALAEDILAHAKKRGQTPAPRKNAAARAADS
jgi:hypothetical protein